MRVRSANNHVRVVLALTMAIGGCGEHGSGASTRRPVVSDSAAAPARITEAGGEVAPDSAKPTVRWLSDGSIVALVNAMIAKQLTAADVELSSWHVDTVRAFAAEMAREHAALQRSIDSAASALQIAPVTPALAGLVQARMQGQIDSMYAHSGRAFDRAYLDQQVASHQLMYKYLTGLAETAEHAGLQQVLSTASDSVQSQLSRATALRAAFAKADSAAADSAAQRAARRAARYKPGRNR